MTWPNGMLAPLPWITQEEITIEEQSQGKLHSWVILDPISCTSIAQRTAKTSLFGSSRWWLQLPFVGSVQWSVGHDRHIGERQSIAQKGVRAIDARNSQLEMVQLLQKHSVRAPGLSTDDEREHPFV